MSEVRQAVVSLTMETSSAQQNLRGLSAAVKQANASFAEASAGVKGFENTTAGMRAKVAQLTDTLDAQKKTQQQYANVLAKSTQRLTNAKAKEEGLAKAVKDAEAAYKASVDAKGKDAAETQALAKELDKAKASQVANEKAMRSAAKSIQDNEIKLTQANAAVKSTAKALDDANKKLDQFGGKWKDAMRKASDGAKAVADKATALGKSVTTKVTMPIVALGTAAVKSAIEWDTAWVGVQKTVDGTETQMAALRDGLIDLGGKLPMSLSGIAGVAEAAGQLGIQNENILGFTETMVNLGNATNLSAEAAATAAAQFANIYQMNQKDFDKWGSTVVSLGNNFATTEKDIVDMSMGLAAAGKQAKLSEADTLALATALSSLGLEAAGGSSSVSKVMMDMGIAVDKGGKQLKNFAKVSGMTSKEFKVQWEKDPAKAIDSFIQGLGKIEQSGGNVALTLQNMGYNERRVLDSLQRLTGAGDLFSRALNMSNAAWRQNTALTNEAEKRNNSLAGILTRTKNRITAASIEIGEKLTPYLRQAADWVAGLVEGFRNLDPAVQANIMKWAGIVAAIGPALLIFGKVAGAISTITKLLAGPAGWTVLGVAAVAGLGIALSKIKKPSDALKESLQNIKIKVNTSEVTGIESSIQAGIDAANKEYDISVTVKGESDALKKSINGFLEDGKLTRKERVAFAKEVSDQVNATLIAADTSLKETAESMRQTLSGLNIPEDEQESIIANVTEKTTTATSELKTYKDELDKLLAEIGRNKGAATQEQITALNTLLEKIGLIREEIALANDEAILAARGFYERTVAGQGGGEITGQAVGYSNQKYLNEISRISAAAAEERTALEKARSGAEEESDAFKKISADIQRNIDEETAALAEARERWQTELSLILSGEMKRTGADVGGLDELNEYKTELQSLLDGLYTVISPVIGADKAKDLDSLKKSLEAALKNFELPDDLKQKISDLLAGEDVSAAEWSDLANDIDKVIQPVEEQLKTAVEALGENADFNAVLQALFNNVDSKQIDTTLADGALADVLNYLDLTGKAKEYGIDVSKGIGTGVVDGSKEALEPMNEIGAEGASNLVDSLVAQLRAGKSSVYSAAYELALAADQGFKDGAGIASPSKKAKWNASMIIRGMTEGLTGGMSSLAKISSQLGAVSIPQYLPQLANGNITRNNTINANTTNNFQNLNLYNNLDAEALAIQLEAERRRKLAGYGLMVRWGV